MLLILWSQFWLGGWFPHGQGLLAVRAVSPRSQPSAPLRASEGSALFRRSCSRCHGTDGKGQEARDELPSIPDFTSHQWQKQRSDAQLLTSIVDGKGKQMPPFGEKLSRDQARDLIAHIRAFSPTKQGPDGRRGPEGDPLAQFDREFGRLQQQMDELKKQSRELSKAPPGSARRPSSESPQRAASRRPAAREGRVSAARALFQQHCAECHGADGTGSQARGRLPKTPNFADAAWQARRSDAQLLASILDGQGKKMPPWRDELGEEQARDLVAYVRGFGPTEAAREQEQAPEPTPGLLPSEPEKVVSSMGFFEKLIAWLGKSHPAAVHFPIALLAAAAAAELLRMGTGQPAFHAAARYCVWFGALAALAAGTLGWFLGGFQLTDPSWIMSMHRWLGTVTVTWALLVLLLSEWSRRSGRDGTRQAFRITLLGVAGLVLATGFFGGVLVYGFEHYAWPQ
jgi:mono/diheme cytochrome c family protein/uncharacterized membrane protein